MDPISARDLLPRVVLGLFIAAAAAAGAYALNQFDSGAYGGEGSGIVSIGS